MDEDISVQQVQQGPTPQPTTFSASSKPRSLARPGLSRLGWVLGVVVLMGVGIFLLHYFEVIYLGEQLPFLPSKSGGDQNITKSIKTSVNTSSKAESIGSVPSAGELVLACPSSEEAFCKTSKDVFKDGEYIGLGGKVSSESAIVAAFDAKLTLTTTHIPSQTDSSDFETFTTLYLENGLRGLLARYIFKGELLKSGSVQEGDTIASTTGEPINYYEDSSLLFAISEDYSAQDVIEGKFPIKAEWVKISSSNFR